MPIVQVNQTNIYYEEHGTGRPLVFVHGLGLTHAMWTPQVETFRRRNPPPVSLDNLFPFCAFSSPSRNSRPKVDFGLLSRGLRMLYPYLESSERNRKGVSKPRPRISA